MPEVALPRTHRARMALLESISQREQSLALLPSWLSTRFDVLRAQFHTRYTQECELVAERQCLHAEKERALVDLNMLIRHYWHGIRLQVRRRELPVEAFIHIGLNREGRNLRLVRIGEKLNAARMLVGGAAEMASWGWQLHQQPAADDVRAAAERVIALDSGYGHVADRLVRLQRTMKAEAGVIDRIFRQIYQSIRLALREWPAAGQRQILRHYGFSFRYRPDRDGPARRRSQPSTSQQEAILRQETKRASETEKPARPRRAYDTSQDPEEHERPEDRPPEALREGSKRELASTPEERQRTATVERQVLRRLARKDRYRRGKNRRRRNRSMSLHPPDRIQTPCSMPLQHSALSRVRPGPDGCTEALPRIPPLPPESGPLPTLTSAIT